MLSELISFLSTVPTGKEVVTILLIVILAALISITVKIVFTILSLLAQKTKTTLDDDIIKQTKHSFYHLAIITAAYLSIFINYGNAKIQNITIFDLYIIGVLIVGATYINRIIDVLLVWYAKWISPTKHTRKEIFPFIRNVVKVLFYVAFAILILSKLGIEVAPLVAGLGIAGLAVALALQDTLSNFFAGVHILADKPVREGDCIRLENGMEGTVAAIGWRTTRIRTATKNDIIIPNAKLAQSIIVNYHTTNAEIGVIGEIGVSYKEDIEKVQQVILETIRAVQKKNTKIVQHVEPWVRFEKLGDRALLFKYGYTVENFDAQTSVLGEINKELFHAIKKNKIEIPYQVD